MTRSETFEYSTVIKAGELVNVINPRTGKPMGGKWTFRAHITGKDECIEVWGGLPGREKIRSFTVGQIEPKGR